VILPGGKIPEFILSYTVYIYLNVSKDFFVYFIVEFPAVLLDLCNGEVVSKFQQYVRPSEHQQLSAFCTNLTGITQVCIFFTCYPDIPIQSDTVKSDYRRDNDDNFFDKRLLNVIEFEYIR